MPRDYANKNRKTSKRLSYKPYQKSSLRKKLSWVALILLMVILPAFIFSLSTIKKRSSQKIAAKQVKPVKTSPETPEPIHFDFYTILPKTTVDIPGENQVQLEKHRSYLVQIASLKTLKEAKAFRKKLKKMGFNADIHALQRNHTKWYRIQIGPFDNKDFAQEIHDRLQERNISSLVVSGV
jgi:cell division protein FtsN